MRYFMFLRALHFIFTWRSDGIVIMDKKAELLQIANECYDAGIQNLNEGKLKNSEEMLIRAKDIYNETGEKKRVAQVPTTTRATEITNPLNRSSSEKIMP